MWTVSSVILPHLFNPVLNLLGTLQVLSLFSVNLRTLLVFFQFTCMVYRGSHPLQAPDLQVHGNRNILCDTDSSLFQLANQLIPTNCIWNFFFFFSQKFSESSYKCFCTERLSLRATSCSCLPGACLCSPWHMGNPDQEHLPFPQGCFSSVQWSHWLIFWQSVFWVTQQKITWKKWYLQPFLKLKVEVLLKTLTSLLQTIKGHQ